MPSALSIIENCIFYLKIFDKNHDGFIDKAELKDVLIKLGENITDVSPLEILLS